MKLRRLSVIVTLTLLCILGSSPMVLDANDWVPPTSMAPGLEISANPQVWERIHAKGLAPVFDRTDGTPNALDLMGFYFDQEVDRLSFKVNFYRPPGTDKDAPLLPQDGQAYVLMDYMAGGQTDLPGSVEGSAPFAWDRAVRLEAKGGNLVARVVDDLGSERESERLRKVVGSSKWSTAEASMWLPEGFKDAVKLASGKPGQSYEALAQRAAATEATPIQFYVFTAQNGMIVDDLLASNQAYAPTTNTHNVAFMQHGNQGLTYTDVFRGTSGENAVYDGDPNNPDNGFDEILDAHDYYNLPLNWHQGGLLITAAAEHDPAFNAQLLAGVNAGRYEIITSAYGQHMMPFVRDEINGKAVDIENSLINYHYNYTPRVAWVPERVWVENPDDDGNGSASNAGVIDYIEDDFTDNGVWAVILDDYIHATERNNALDDHHVYTYGNGIKILPIDNDFVGQVNNSAGDAWNTILAGTSDEIIIYGNDAEFVAEVSQGTNTFALGNYIWLLQQCSNNSATVGVWKLTDVLNDPGFTVQSINLHNGTYGLLGGFDGYGGGNNFWYADYAGYTGPSNLDAHAPKWDYGAQWDFALNKILSVPNNNLREMAWYILLTNLHETGWHDNGQISGWQHHYANHMRSANAHSEAARWAAGLYATTTGAYIADFEDDGADELVMYNDRVLAVFDGIGGKLQWMFAKGTGYNYSVVSNDNVYWVDTDGDYNETNHVAGLSDVSVGGVGHDSDLYSFNIITGSGNNLEACIQHAAVTKIVRLNLGDPYLSVAYRAGGQNVFVKNGMSPDLLDLTWNAQMDRVWDPDGGGYFGQKNPNTGATTGIVVGAGGAFHNLQFDSTLMGVDEFFGQGAFEIIFYGGSTSAADSTGAISELRALRDGLTDTLGPMASRGTYFPTSKQLTLYFDDLVNPASINLVGLGVDENGDTTPEVSLTGSETVTTASDSRKIDISLSVATANAIEALNPAALTLVLGTSAVADPSGNPNENSLCGTPVVASIDVAPLTKVQIDGLVDRTSPTDWLNPKKEVLDFWDSLWNGTAPGDTNEINVVGIDWDDTYLYLSIQGFVSGNSWILYLDTDYTGPKGQIDLTAIDTWERGATFSDPNFRPDFHYGAFQHQGAFDSHSLWELTSDTTSVDISSQVVMAFDPSHLNGYLGGSELAIPWDVLYGLGAGQVPPGAVIAVSASICYDPEPGGELGGDSAPNNSLATLPEIDEACALVVDANRDGLPDAGARTGVDDNQLRPATLMRAFPNPTHSNTEIRVSIPTPAGKAGVLGNADQGEFKGQIEVFDVRGRRVRTIFDDTLSYGTSQFRWDGKDESGRDVGTGIFFLRASIENQAPITTKLTRIK